MVDVSGVTVAQATGPATPPQISQQSAPSQPLTDAEISTLAEEVLDEGHRWSVIPDDYDARLDRFAEVTEGLDADSASRLFAEVLRQDPGAISYWLSARQLTALVDAGRVTSDQAGAVADALAQSYNDGAIEFVDAHRFLGLNEATHMAPGLRPDAFRAPLDFLNNGASTAEINQFREAFGQDILARVADPNRLGALGLEAGFAVTLMSESGDSAMVARVYAGFNAAERQRILTDVGQDGIGYMNSRGELPGLADPLSVLISSVADQRTSTYAGLAREIVGFANSAPDRLFYDYGAGGYQQPIADRADALGQLFVAHQDTILDNLTDLNISTVPGSRTGETYAYQNATALGNLLRLTALNPDNAYQTQVMDGLQSHTQDLKALANTPPGELDSAGRVAREEALDALKMLGIASKDAVNQAYFDVHQHEQATRALVDFVVDIGLAGVPLGSMTNTQVKALLGGIFDNNPAVDRALQNVGGDLTDRVTGQLESSARDAIAQALIDDATGVDTLRETADNLIQNAVLNGLEIGASDVRVDIMNTAEDLRIRR